MLHQLRVRLPGVLLQHLRQLGQLALGQLLLEERHGGQEGDDLLELLPLFAEAVESQQRAEAILKEAQRHQEAVTAAGGLHGAHGELHGDA